MIWLIAQSAGILQVIPGKVISVNDTREQYWKAKVSSMNWLHNQYAQYWLAISENNNKSTWVNVGHNYMIDCMLGESRCYMGEPNTIKQKSKLTSVKSITANTNGTQLLWNKKSCYPTGFTEIVVNIYHGAECQPKVFQREMHYPAKTRKWSAPTSDP